MDRIIDNIAPMHRIQCCNKYNKWYSSNIKKLGQLKDISHSKAKNSNNPEHWRLYRVNRNLYYNAIKAAKKEHFYKKLTIRGKNDRVKIKDEHKNSNNLWGTVKEMTNTRNKVPPRMIIHEGNILLHQ